MKCITATARMSDTLPTALDSCSVISLSRFGFAWSPILNRNGIWNFSGNTVVLSTAVNCPHSLDELDGGGDSRPYWQGRPILKQGISGEYPLYPYDIPVAQSTAWEYAVTFPLPAPALNACFWSDPPCRNYIHQSGNTLVVTDAVRWYVLRLSRSHHLVELC